MICIYSEINQLENLSSPTFVTYLRFGLKRLLAGSCSLSGEIVFAWVRVGVLENATFGKNQLLFVFYKVRDEHVLVTWLEARESTHLSQSDMQLTSQ
jgi:hypothetical protein